MEVLNKLKKWILALGIASIGISFFSAFMTHAQIVYIGYEDQGSAKVLVVGTCIVALFAIFSLKCFQTLKQRPDNETLHEVLNLFRILVIFICTLVIIMWTALYLL